MPKVSGRISMLDAFGAASTPGRTVCRSCSLHVQHGSSNRRADFTAATNGFDLAGAGQKKLVLSIIMADSGVHSLGAELLQPRYARTLGSLRASANGTLKFVVGEERLNWTNFTIAAVVLVIASAVILQSFGKKRKNLPPAIPGGLPFLGNILQLNEAKPFRTFRDWSFKYGPIFRVQTGSVTSVVINNAELCKEAFVTKHNSISSRKHYTGMQVLTCDKRIVAMSDYGPAHIKLKKVYVGHLLAPNIQKQNRPIREKNLVQLLDNMVATVQGEKSHMFDVSDLIKQFLYPFTMEQVFGYVPDNVYVPELGRHLGKWEMYDKLVVDILTNVVAIDWRNFFPAFRFLGNKALDRKLTEVVETRAYIMDALIELQKKRIAEQGATQCYGDILLTECADWEPIQIRMSVWEPIIEGVDSSLVTTEWTLFEIIRNPKIQERLYKEIKSVVGDRMVTEDDIEKMPLLTACIQETLRVYTALPLLPPRFVHDEDVTLGGYDIPKGTDVLFNLYAVNMDPTVWKDPMTWNPDRLLDNKKMDWHRDIRMMPFGGGKRMCQGITQVMYVIPMTVASFLLHFDWSEPDLTPEERSAHQDTKILTTHKLHPLKAIAKPRVDSRLKFSEAVELRFQGK